MARPEHITRDGSKLMIRLKLARHKGMKVGTGMSPSRSNGGVLALEGFRDPDKTGRHLEKIHSAGLTQK